jgi:hypothetical protein
MVMIRSFGEPSLNLATDFVLTIRSSQADQGPEAAAVAKSVPHSSVSNLTYRLE